MVLELIYYVFQSRKIEEKTGGPWRVVVPLFLLPPLALLTGLNELSQLVFFLLIDVERGMEVGG